MKTCLLVVDVQNGFVSDSTRHVPGRIAELLGNNLFDLTLFTRFRNAPASPYRRLLGWQKLSSTSEQELHESVVGFADEVIEKDVYTAVCPSLLARLKDEKIETVFIAGIDTDCCVLTTATDLFEAGIRSCVLSHYSGSNGGADSHTAALTCLGRLIGLHNLIAGVVDAERVAEIVAHPLPDVASDAVLDKRNGFVTTREDALRILSEAQTAAAQKTVDLLSIDFGELLDASVGVWERYTLREHVYMVVGQYERYFAGSNPGGLCEEDVLLLLALHDIGKPAAVQAGDKSQQHEYSAQIGSAFLAHLGYREEDRLMKLLGAINSGDPIGKMLKTGDVDACLPILENAATLSGMSESDYLDFVLVYFMVDASSYTSDAIMPDGRPGFESLDWLFVFDHEAGRMALEETTALKIKRLHSAATTTGS